jgi:gamma-glutamylcyclotransferase (GGCT)/AIG2-like uncharacterized protein YtfP
LLRIILWKTGFEWAHLKRILSPATRRKIYYFAFGANLSPEILKLRRIRVYEAFNYVLGDACLRFSLAGFYRDHGYASADAAEGESVFGKMYLILERDAERMDYFEGVPFLRVHEKVFGEVYGSDFFFYRAIKAQQGLKPTQEYLDYLTTAYREMPEVPEAYVESLAATEVLDQLLPPDQTGEFVKNIDRWPSFLHSTLIIYEGLCQRTVEFLWNRSLLHWMIRY